MAFNGSGVFVRLYSWVTDRDAGTKILAARVDEETNGIVVGLNSVVNGTQPFIAPVRSSFGTAASPAHSFSADTDTGLFRKAANTLGLSTGGTERLSLDTATLTVATNASFAGTAISSTPNLVPLEFGAYLVSDGRYRAQAANEPCFDVSRAGSVGSIMVFRQQQAAVGSISVTGSATAYNTSSDYRLKENVAPIKNATDTLMALNPVNFTFKADGTAMDGFLAHEIQEFIPSAVMGEKDGPVMQSMDYSRLTPILTAALQEANRTIASLTKRIEALEAAS